MSKTSNVMICKKCGTTKTRVPDSAPRYAGFRLECHSTTCVVVEPIKIHIQSDRDQWVFTTNYREVYERLMKFCDGSNVTEGPSERNGFHAQCWFSKQSNLSFEEALWVAMLD